MSRIAELREIISRFDLNTHPFYVDWRMGTLPMERLQDYAHGYGRFIETIAQGWDAVGESAIANTERDHFLMWQRFSSAVDVKVSKQAHNSPAHYDALVGAAQSAFRYGPESIGGLYAFEQQQPLTATSKLAGLKEHYPVAESGREYFEVHKEDWDEPALLESKLESLSEDEYARAKTACAVMCSTMWMALDGAYYC